MTGDGPLAACSIEYERCHAWADFTRAYLVEREHLESAEHHFLIRCTYLKLVHAAPQSILAHMHGPLC